MKPSIEQLRTILKYDPETGALTRLYNSGPGQRIMLVDREAGCVDPSNGVWRVVAFGKRMPKASVCWALQTGKWPEMLIDHIDTNKDNHRFSNLREATYLENSWNHNVRIDSKTQVKGVTLCKSTGRYRADIRIAGKTKNLGRFKTVEEASNAYAAAAKLHFGEFARVG